jgi:acetylglutamate kinase
LQDAIKKADVLVEAMSWIRQFRGQTTVIKLGGSVMKNQRALEDILNDIVFMETVGMHPVIVHGGGAAISSAMDAAGIKPKFVQGRRYTDTVSLSIVEDVLVKDINASLAECVKMFGGHAAALCFDTHNVLRGRRLSLVAANGDDIDLGLVGEVTDVDSGHLRQLCDDGVVPIIPSMCIDDNGQKYNVNADTAATAVAISLRANKLVFLSDVNGVRMDKDEPNSLIHSLDSMHAKKLIQDGTIDSGMIPKIESCLETLEAGVGKVHIIDGRLRHSLLLEIYTDSGIGTEIVN